MKTIGIIGGGFSGTMTAVNLMRLAETPVQVVLINAGRSTGRGTAYSTKRLDHLLNVAARNMSAVPDHPNHFVEWLSGRGEFVDIPEVDLRELFVPRRIYGDYLHSLVMNYFHPIDDHHSATVEIVEDEAIDIINRPEERPLISLAHGDALEVDQVLLATGNPPPASLRGQTGPFEHPKYVSDPWGDWENRLPAPSRDVVMLGTGLTMVDVFLSLKSRGWTGQMTAISRKGLLPRSHFVGIEYPDYLATETDPVHLEDALRLVETHCRLITQMNQNGAIAVDKLRPHTQRLWLNFSTEEKRTFLKEHAARWNASRHRIAASIHQQLSDALASGQLKIRCGSIDSLDSAADKVVVNIQDASGEKVAVEGGFVINCTGPQSAFSRTNSTLFQNLIQRGLVVPDEMDMGIAISEDFAVTNDAGESSNWLFAIGPILKGTLWETIAVPELRGQAHRVAQVLLDAASAPIVSEEYVLEYCI